MDILCLLMYYINVQFMKYTCLSKRRSAIIQHTLQENSGILTDIPTENEILGISRGISEETQNLVSSEYTDGIPRKY